VPTDEAAAVHVAQINIGTMVASTDDPAVAEFMNALDEINAIADDAFGFVWRLQTDEGNATSIQIFANPLELLNMSVWESVEALKAYVYRTEHVDFFRRRSEWFEADAKRVALWHVAPGTIPELDEAVRRVEFLERHGPSPYAFGFGGETDPLTFAIVDGTVIAKAGGRVVGTATDTGHIDLVDDTVPLLAAALADQCELVASRSN
jgi:hypothetical protein